MSKTKKTKKQSSELATSIKVAMHKDKVRKERFLNHLNEAIDLQSEGHYLYVRSLGSCYEVSNWTTGAVVWSAGYPLMPLTIKQQKKIIKKRIKGMDVMLFASCQWLIHTLKFLVELERKEKEESIRKKEARAKKHKK